MPSQEHQQIVDFLRSASATSPRPTDFGAARANLDQMGELFAVPDAVAVEGTAVAGVPCEWLVPTGPTTGTLVYLHGGAYTAGSLRSHRALSARIALATGCRVLAVDYRLAPEHPFPAGLEDCVAVVDRLLAEGLDPAELLIAGDSAGGGMATALLLRRQMAGQAPLAGGVLLSPWLDLRLGSASMDAKAEEDPMLDRALLANSVRAYVEDVVDPMASPLLADPAGLPPLLILVGTAEVLLDDSLAFAAAARAAGVAVDLDVEEGLIHVWPFLDGVPEAAAAMERIGGWAQSVLPSAI